MLTAYEIDEIRQLAKKAGANQPVEGDQLSFSDLCP
jgi:hypothetical protein